MNPAPFCAPDITNEEDWTNLHPSAHTFLQQLDLPRIHPHCSDDSMFRSLQQEPLPLSEHDLLEHHYYERSMGIMSKAITLWYQISPALLAMTELWLRLFAFVIAPLSVAYLISNEYQSMSKSKSSGSEKDDQDSRSLRRIELRACFVILIGMAACMVLLTDTMYVQAHGRQYGGSIYILMAILTFRKLSSFSFYRRRVVALTCTMIFISIYLLCSSEGDLNNPGIDLPTIEPGLYYDTSNPLMRDIAQLWPKHSRTYDGQHGATPYLITGDGLTGIPFLVNSSPSQSYHRVWVENTQDGEAVALDIAFGVDGVHDTSKPVFLILHGLNGGSHEEYVREFVVRKTKEGNTCIVMIARGLMDTPVRGWNLFHGARTLDIAAASKAVRRAIQPGQTLAGVGFSMGAIVLANYVARSGTDCHLDTAVSVSGGLDMREQLTFRRSMRLWQPMLSQGLREDFLVEKFDPVIRQRLTNEQHLNLMRASSVSAVDTHSIVPYHGYDDITHYYTEMSAMGDTTAFQQKQNNSLGSDNDDEFTSIGRIGQVSIPFCVLHALDDPLISWRTLGHDIDALTRTGSGNIMMLLTKSGGHVGWPLGLNPRLQGWKWMHTAVSDFVISVDSAKKELSL